ncbi:hypothetical protein [Clostridium baratii]|uniref:hypothetical protein n=1 Tax=Clostridium baratii TaxID=1561 RepID=UPI0030CE1377
MYNVEEVAKRVGVSKVTVYKKIKNLKELEKFIVNKEDRVYILDEGVKILKESIDKNKHNPNKINVEDEVSVDLESNKELINMLKDQLKEKDIQLKEKDKQLNELINLNKNNQVLLKQQQDKELQQLQLVEHFEEVDKKLLELKGRLECKKQKRKGILEKFKIIK